MLSNFKRKLLLARQIKKNALQVEFLTLICHNKVNKQCLKTTKANNPYKSEIID